MSIDISSLDAVELEALVMRISKRRAQLTPEVPAELPKYTYGYKDPRWFVSTKNGEILLHLRDSGLGWSTFILPLHEALSLGKVLLKAAEDLALSNSTPASTVL